MYMSRPAIAVRFFIGRMSAGPSELKKNQTLLFIGIFDIGMKIQFAVNVAKNNKETVDLWFMDEGLFLRSKKQKTESKRLGWLF